MCLPVMWGADGNEVVVDDGGVRVLAEEVGNGGLACSGRRGEEEPFAVERADG